MLLMETQKLDSSLDNPYTKALECFLILKSIGTYTHANPGVVLNSKIHWFADKLSDKFNGVLRKELKSLAKAKDKEALFVAAIYAYKRGKLKKCVIFL